MKKETYLETLQTLQALAKRMQAHERRVQKRDRQRMRKAMQAERERMQTERESAYFARTTFQDCKGARTRKRCTEHVGRVAGCKIRDVRTSANSVVVCRSRQNV